jgi:hypothetical protein
VTTATVTGWAPPLWTTIGAAGVDQRTPELKTIVQEIVNRPGWVSGNALGIVITGPGGVRSAGSFDNGTGSQPVLHVEFTTTIDEESQLTRLRAHNDATNNYYGMSFVGSIEFHRVYIDRDESTASGFLECGVGADYLIENTGLYEYTGDGESWSWNQIATLSPTITSTSASWTVSRSLLNESAFPNTARMCFVTDTFEDVTDTSPIYQHVYSNETVPVHAYVAYNDASTIFYQATFDNSVTYKHVFIDVDESTTSGYIEGGIGADYMIENETLYDYTGDGDSWSWSPIGSANMFPTTIGATGITTWSIARSSILEEGDGQRADVVFHGSPTYAAIYDHVYSDGGGGGGGGGSGGPTDEDLSYVDDSDDVALKNPERGIYYWSPQSDARIVAEWLWLGEGTVCNDNLVWNGYNVTGTSDVLNQYAWKLIQHREAGRKVLFRPRYDKSDQEGLPNDCGMLEADTKARMKNHVDAIAKMLGAYKDVIAFIEIGYLGRWGEWNTGPGQDSLSPVLTNITEREDFVKYVIDKYQAAPPLGQQLLQHIGFRRPIFHKDAVYWKPGSRAGIYNDCFMSDEDDYHTYRNYDSGNPRNFTSTQAAIDYAEAESATTSYGGETCGDNGDERWRDCDNMVGAGAASEPFRLHVSYLNGRSEMKAHWQLAQTGYPNGCWDDIRRNIGYRFEVKRVEYTPTVASGGNFTVNIDIKNSGYSRLHRPRTAYIRLRSGSTVYEYTPQLKSATATWEPSQTVTVSYTGAAPPPGTYEVRLAIPDPYNTSHRLYDVKLATKRNGTNVYEAATGENNLDVDIIVQ